MAFTPESDTAVQYFSAAAPDTVKVPAGCTVHLPRLGAGILRTYNYFANSAPFVREDGTILSGVQEDGTGSDGSFNIGWVQRDALTSEGYFDLLSTDPDPLITATAIPFLDRITMDHWYLDDWSGGDGTANTLSDLGSTDVIVRYKDPSVVHLGYDEAGRSQGWLMLVARNVVREEIADDNGYPAARTNSDGDCCFPDNPGVHWPKSPDGSAWVYPESGPYRSGTYAETDLLNNVSEKCEYLADIVAFWSKKSDFAEVVGPFWVRPSLVSEGAPDEVGEAHTTKRPRYWYGVPGAIVMHPDHSTEAPTLYVYFVKDVCYHNHADREWSVGVVGDPVSYSDGTLTESEQNYYLSADTRQKLILRKISVADILDMVDAAGVTPGICDSASWDEAGTLVDRF